MNLYAIKYRLKGEKVYTSAIFIAENEDQLSSKIQYWLNKKNQSEVDKRTIKWAGASIPAAINDEPLIIYTDLDNHV